MSPLRIFRRRREPVLSSDHSLDFTADDFSSPARVCFIAPELVHLAAMLTALSPERRQVLAESETPNGWPAWWRTRFYGDDDDHWEAFKLMCAEVFDNLDAGIPAENSLVAIELAGDE